MIPRCTVGELIDEGIRTTRHCECCGDFADVDLQRIAAGKGRDFSLVDRLPFCTNGDCLGMIRFQIHRGLRAQWLLTPEGAARFQAHSDWLFTYRQVQSRRAAQRAARRTPQT